MLRHREEKLVGVRWKDVYLVHVINVLIMLISPQVLFNDIFHTGKTSQPP